MKKLLAIILTIMIVASASAVSAFAEDGINETVITEDGTYTIGSDCGKLVIDGAKATVNLNDASMSSENLGYSPVIVTNNSDVTFVLKGTSNIAGDSKKESCGIQVDFGSDVTFKGDGTLNVTGGKYGAAIGSFGTGINIPEDQRVLVGTITIDSGIINAYAGARGAGIGAGYHVNGNSVTINGGLIHAYGKECGAGIGCGYGTSGGAIGVAAVGEYDSGKIVINGGEVYAATTDKADFNSRNYSDLNANDPGSFAAGIGGGYGASASDIKINGGKVVAIGSCGGAGIGAGRGTSSASKYNKDAYKVNVKIGGNADVTAIAATSRSNELNSGGAAIGSGRGSHTGGNIEITGNAKVYALSATGASAIGASKQKSPVDGSIPKAESIKVGDNVNLYAVSKAEYAVDKDAETLSIDPKYFGSSDKYFFGEDAVAISDCNNVIVESPKGNMTYVAPADSVSLWSRIAEFTEPANDNSNNNNNDNNNNNENNNNDNDNTNTPASGNSGNSGSDNDDDSEATVTKSSLGIVTPLAMAVRFEDGSVYYSGDTVEIEIGKEYRFQMCCVDWSTRDTNNEKKVHKPYEVFSSPQHGIYSDEGLGLRGTVVYTVKVSNKYDERSYDADTKTFVLPKGDAVLRTDVNKCFMAYRFTFKSGDYNKQTGIENVVYDTGKDHENTLEDFRYNKPLEFLSVNLPLGSTIKAIAYNNYEKIGEADVFVKIDEENPEESYTTYVWDY